MSLKNPIIFAMLLFISLACGEEDKKVSEGAINAEKKDDEEITAERPVVIKGSCGIAGDCTNVDRLILKCGEDHPLDQFKGKSTVKPLDKPVKEEPIELSFEEEAEEISCVEFRDKIYPSQNNE